MYAKMRRMFASGMFEAVHGNKERSRGGFTKNEATSDMLLTIMVKVPKRILNAKNKMYSCMHELLNNKATNRDIMRPPVICH